MPSILELIGILGKSGKFASDLLRTANKDIGNPDKWDIDSDRITKYDGNAPTPSGYFDIVGQHSWREYFDMFEDIFMDLFQYAQRFDLFNRPVELFIDSTTLPFYPDLTDENGDFILPTGVTGSAKSAHTHYGFTFFTVSALDPRSGRTFTLASFPKWKNGLTHDAIKYLLDKARQFVDIDQVYMDSEFRAIETLNWLDDENIDFIIRYPKKGWRREWLKALTGYATAATVTNEIDPSNKDESGEYTFIAARRKSGDLDIDMDEEDDQENYTLSDFVEDTDDFTQSSLTDFDEYLEDATGAWDLYVTNIDDASSSTARGMKNQYNRRSAIEPEYDYSKNGSIARGGGRNYEVRVLYWMLGIVTLNAVKLIDLRLKSQNGIPLDRDEYDIPIKECVRLMFTNPYFDAEYG